MAGLNFGAGTGLLGSYTRAPAAVTEPQTAAQAAFGPGATPAAPSAVSVLSPGRAFGLTFWVQVGCVVALIVLRASLKK